MNAGFEPTRTHHSAHPSIVPFQAFEASDGWFVLAAAKEKFWSRVAEAINRPDLAQNPRFATMAARQEHATELLGILESVFATEPVAHWVKVFRAVGVPTGEVNSVADALDDPHAKARGLIVEAEHPRYGTVKTLVSPVWVGDAFASVVRAPQRGEHTEAVLSELAGMDQESIEITRTRGAFGPVHSGADS